MKLHINDAASLLNLPVNTLKRWIRQGRVPINRSEDICIFKEEKLNEWAKRNHFSFSEKKGIEKKVLDSGTQILSSAVSSGIVLYDVEGSTKEDIFSFVIKNLGIDDDENKNEFLKRLLEREELSSTGIGKGVAIPHPREPLDNLFDSPLIAIVFPKEPLEFDSIDKSLVFVLFFIVSRNVKEHLKLLSNLSYCLRHENFIAFLKNKPSMEKIISEIEFFENQLLNQ
jgi:PTS system nitrogen regulatory IIA component